MTTGARGGRGTVASKDGSTVRVANRSGQSPSRLLTRSDGREVRRLTVYLPTALATRLAKYAAAHDENMSDVIARLLEQGLGR